MEDKDFNNTERLAEIHIDTEKVDADQARKTDRDRQSHRERQTD